MKTQSLTIQENTTRIAGIKTSAMVTPEVTMMVMAIVTVVAALAPTTAEVTTMVMETATVVTRIKGLTMIYYKNENIISNSTKNASIAYL